MEGIGLILGVDRLLDMIRTAVNVSGVAVVTAIVAKSEGKLDVAVYNNPEAGTQKQHDLIIDKEVEAELAAMVRETHAKKE